MPALPRALLACSLLIGPTTAARAQSAVVDEGTFMISRKGAPIGRESFRIVRAPAPGGQVYRATGQSAIGGDRVTTSLATDSSGVPVLYESDLSRGGVLAQKLQGRGRPGRFSVLVQTRTGESAREYVLSKGALLLDENVFHHFFFVPIAAQHARLIVIEPRSAEQGHFELEDRGSDRIVIAGRTLQSRHFVLTGPENDTREVWIDDKGRLLKVSILEKGLVALRDDPPR